MKRKKKKKNQSKWQTIINRCFEKEIPDNQRKWLHQMNHYLKEHPTLSKAQIIVTARIARSLKAYYPEKKYESLTAKLFRLAREKKKRELRIEGVGSFVSRRAKI